MAAMNSEPIIETKDLTIRFGGHVAVDHVNFKMEPFTLKSIIGPNGAGKTTFFNMLTGQYKPTEGKVLLKGNDITRLSTAQRTKLGMGRSFQLTNIFPLLSVLENVRVAIQSREGFGFNFWRSYLHFSAAEDEAYDLLKEVLLDDKWRATSAELTHGEKRKLEIAILLALKPEILFLDEPTAGMGQEEVPAILEMLQRLREARDRTMLLVEHKMDMIMSLSDTIMVLQEGRIIADGEPDEIYRSEAVQEAYLGGGTTRE
ncbi:ABC transporter, ATP-binding protein 1 (cluster 4, leucine/isoleucine/valine/benzoate) [Olavius algarvensis Delta 1 endosymbiont]|nr:ABC transporter, ATP-binding protein 1 (cluster 4, leucine/isoleucine/valine/benzoate) [Olavius algarvensis Delta 1 endosymbiont]